MTTPENGENIYIAGPMCFYSGGHEILNALRAHTESLGMGVSLPNDKDVKLNHEDKRLNADALFANCRDSMNLTSAIISNLEFFRGPEPDGGTIYEIGMAYALGARCYAYTRDKRAMVYKYQGSTIKDGGVYDLKSRPLAYKDLPFSPNVIGSNKIVEGNYADCLDVMRADIEEERKTAGSRHVCAPFLSEKTLHDIGKPIVFLAGPERYSPEAAQSYARMKKLCEARGLYAITPLDDAPGVPRIESDSPYSKAQNTFEIQQQHVRNCDIILANLNDFHGYEPDSDTSFECGMAFQLGKKLFGYMSDTRNMTDKIPNFGEDAGFRDACDCNVENFAYPINLMFSSSMPIYEGGFEEALAQMMLALGK